jgi:hypothetical protein
MATRAAELHHSVYCSSLHVPCTEAIGEPTPSNTSQNLTAQPWERLPGFYQEDNVRQLWHVLAFFTLRGFEWVAVTAHDSPDPELVSGWDALVDQAAQSEYTRWADLRRQYGWWPAKPVAEAEVGVRPYKHDGYRMHSELDGYAEADTSKNRDMVTQVLRRMWAMGYGLRWNGPGSETESQSGAVVERS